MDACDALAPGPTARGNALQKTETAVPAAMSSHSSTQTEMRGYELYRSAEGCKEMTQHRLSGASGNPIAMQGLRRLLEIALTVPTLRTPLSIRMDNHQKG